MAKGEGKGRSSGRAGGRASAPRPRRKRDAAAQPGPEVPAPVSMEGVAPPAERTLRQPSPKSLPEEDPTEVDEVSGLEELRRELVASGRGGPPATLASFEFHSLPDPGMHEVDVFAPGDVNASQVHLAFDQAVEAAGAPPSPDPEALGHDSTSAVAQRIAQSVAAKAGLMADPGSIAGVAPVADVSLPDGAPTRLDAAGSVDFSQLVRPWEDDGGTSGTGPGIASDATSTIAEGPPATAETMDLPDPDEIAAKVARAQVERAKKKKAVEGESVDFYMGGYHVHRRLGQGGMAVVFLARPDGSGEDVVLKRIRPSLVQEERYIKLFMREARVASSLDHENVVRILDHAEESGEYFIVMEYLDGIDLRDLADRCWSQGEALPLEPVLRCLAQSARGLDYAHQKRNRRGELEGLVHRDVSPENLFVTSSGVTKVLDFGIAKGNQHVEKLTRTGEVKGKVPYLAPEQILGQKLDGRCDLFALCVTAYWMLTGTRPFDGTSNFMTIKRIIEHDPSPLTLLNPFIPEAVNDAVLRGLAKDRELRQASCGAFADEIEGLLDRLPPEVTDPRPVLSVARAIPRPRTEPRMNAAVCRPSVEWD